VRKYDFSVVTYGITSGQNFHPAIRTNYVAPEPEGSSRHSQQPATGPYPEPIESTSRTPHPVTEIKIMYSNCLAGDDLPD
jgi:hypothetical protein